MKKTALFLFVMTVTIGAAWSQPNRLGELAIRDHSYFSVSAPPFSEFSNVDRLEGTPFLHEDWQPGRIQYADQEGISELVGIAIDLRTPQQLYAQTESGYIGKLPIEKVSTVWIYPAAGDTLLLEAHNLAEEFSKGEKRRQYYEVVHRGERYMVFHGHTKYLRREDYIENLGMVRRPDEFKSREIYYVYNGARMTEFNLSARSLRKAMPERDGAIKRLLKKHDLKLKDGSDLAYLFDLLE